MPIDKVRSLSYIILAALVASLAIFNVHLWYLQAGKKQLIAGLQSQVQLHEKENKILAERNHSKAMEVDTLRSPDSAYIYEEKAREEYGMIGQNETFFVLMRDETVNIPDVTGLEKHSSEFADTLVLPEKVQGIVTLESIVDPPVVGPVNNSVDSDNTFDNTPAPPPLQLESLQ